MPKPTKVAMVTGASRGIGRGCALELAKKGFDVVLCARTVKEGQAFEHSSTVKKSDKTPLPRSLESVAKEIKALGRQAIVVKLDLLVRKDVETAVETALREWGRIDVLVNNARYIGPGHMDWFIDTPIDLFDQHIQCNVLSPIYLCKLVIPAMRKQGGGVIINVTSGAGWHETPNMLGSGGWGLGYSVSKAAFNRIAPGLAKELKQFNIAVINLEPGFVGTERLAQDMGPFGFDVSKALNVDVPGLTCAHLATHPTPLYYSGLNVFAPGYVVEQKLVDGTKLPAPYGPSMWGMPRPTLPG